MEPLAPARFEVKGADFDKVIHKKASLLIKCLCIVALCLHGGHTHIAKFVHHKDIIVL